MAGVLGIDVNRSGIGPKTCQRSLAPGRGNNALSRSFARHDVPASGTGDWCPRAGRTSRRGSERLPDEIVAAREQGNEDQWCGALCVS